MDKLEIWDRILNGEGQSEIARELGVSRQRIWEIWKMDRVYWEARVGLRGRPPMRVKEAERAERIERLKRVCRAGE